MVETFLNEDQADLAQKIMTLPIDDAIKLVEDDIDDVDGQYNDSEE